MLAEMLDRIPEVAPEVEVTFLSFDQFGSPAALVEHLQTAHRDSTCVIGCNLHIEVMWEFSLALARWCAAQGVPLYDNVQDYWPQHFEGLRTLVSNWGVRLAAASPFLQEHLGGLGFGSQLTPMGAQLPRVRVPSTRTGPAVVKSVGRVIRRKRFSDIVRGFAQSALADRAVLDLTLLNSHSFSAHQDQEQFEAVKQTIASSGLPAEAIRVRTRPEVPPDYAACSIYVCASDYEGFSMPQYEAAYCGCVPIVSDIPPHRTMAESLFGVHADLYVFPVGDIEALAARLRDEAVTGRRARMLHSNHDSIRTKIESRFSLDVTARAFGALVRQAVSQPAAAGDSTR